MAKKKTKIDVQEGVLLSGLTTIKLGGEAKYYIECASEDEIISALKYADENELKVFILSGGSNVVFPDEGFDGLVIRVNNKGVEFNGETVTAKAGEVWDALVEKCIDNDLQGIECLSGIPGSVGSTPIQNVGAYGQEVRDVIVSVRAIDRDILEEVQFNNTECGFSYRSSRFKAEDKDKYIITEVTFILEKGKVPQIKYSELNKYLNEHINIIKLNPGKEMLTAVRNAVIDIRKTKSMVLDANDPNSVSCGSFFLNPILDQEEYIRFKRACRRKNINYPRFKTPEGKKIPAAWIIENAGFKRGYRKGNVGISENHSLALVNYGGGTTAELLELAEEILEKVEDQLRVELFFEPVIVNN